MPRWTDLRIYITCDFDIGSALTFSFGIKAFWLEPRAFGAAPGNRRNIPWQARIFPVDQKSVQIEQREFLAFLQHLHGILTDNRLTADTKVQIYIWDRLRYDHLCRVIGRHLDAVLLQQTIGHLAWLFPPEELLPNPQMEMTPITIVQDVVRSVLAAPVPHYYSLLAVARTYHDAGLPANIAAFSIHPLFEDELSDQIPSERAHEIWTRNTVGNANWALRLQQLNETVSKHLSALETVVRRLETDLRPLLGKTAPTIQIGPPQRQTSVSHDGQLWYAFTRLNDAMSRLEVDQIRAMPVHEREARFKSARLELRLTGNSEHQALAQLGLAAQRGRCVYRLAPGSIEVAAREGDIAWALAPAG
jgi:hypothetical protein